MIIRKARLNEVSKVVKLADLLVNSTKSENWTNDALYLEQEKKKQDYLENLTKFYTKKIHSKNAILLVAENEGKLVGYLLAYIVKEIPIYVIDKTGYIGDIYVLPEYRGRGIATKLKDAAFLWFSEKGINTASIKTRFVNKNAIKIYKKWGFFEYTVSLRKKI